MRLTQRVKKMLDGYEGETPGTKAKLSRIMMQGKPGGANGGIIGCSTFQRPRTAALSMLSRTIEIDQGKA